MDLLNIKNIEKTIETRCKGITRILFANDNIDALKIIIERRENGKINIDISSFGIRDDKENPFYKQKFDFKLEKQQRKMNPKSKLNLLQGKKKQQTANVVEKINNQIPITEIAKVIKSPTETISNEKENIKDKVDIFLNNTKILKLDRFSKIYKKQKTIKNTKKQKTIKNNKNNKNIMKDKKNGKDGDKKKKTIDLNGCNKCIVLKKRLDELEKELEYVKRKREDRKKEDCYLCYYKEKYNLENYTLGIDEMINSKGKVVESDIEVMDGKLTRDIVYWYKNSSDNERDPADYVDTDMEVEYC